MFQIGPYNIDSQVILAPMAGVTDQPFRQLCRRLGAGLVVSEMVTSDTRLWNSRKSAHRLNHTGEDEPRSVQIAGGDPLMMAQAARMNAERGAQIIDINMGCPAKKVCNKAAGSALLKDEPLVLSILQAVVSAVDIPVTLKIRTGWSTDQKNAETVARMAEDSGIQALAIHGRTRACGYKGEAEYDTIANVRKIIEIPLFANGDISSPEKAKEVLNHTGANAVMIGRTAQGNPWIFKEIDHYLRHNERLEKPALKEVKDTLLSHVAALHQFYGEYLGVRIARKHVGWYLHHQPKGVSFRAHFNQLESAIEQVAAIEQYFKQAHVTIAAA
ncbi:tRNA dihydrouridine synthase DusB [Neptunomonas japonica]|uniref:tRNA-dihydrouridine synthase B n=1 Tax=Neptunomonas japonica JAMM 1380 TaxID=1441457 RepID=A0A7R6SXR4_9GAMM|nr:tRNA dihydrouridine synthase DusB [Neptunomonas japonica]BBB30917.1 tRNA-dihydrouridine synthase B [Neptunomonas japonica JAMM 1380]